MATDAYRDASLGTIRAGEDLRTHRGRCMDLDNTGRFVRATAGELCRGILQEGANTGQVVLVAGQRGYRIVARVSATSPVAAGDDVVVGVDRGIADAAGYSGDVIIGQAIQAGGVGTFVAIIFTGYDGVAP